MLKQVPALKILLLASALTAAVGFAQLTSASTQTQSAPPAPQQPTARPAPPIRDPHTPGYVKAKQLPDGTVPPSNADGNFIIGPTHTPASGMTAPDLTNGSVVEFTMNSTNSKYWVSI